MTRARNLANLGNKNAITADIGLFNIGIGSTQPTNYKLEVVGGNAYVGGGVTITGNLSVGGTVTYEDVTNVDSVGIITAAKGFRATAGGIVVTAGVSTFPVIAVSAGTTTKDLLVTGVTTATGAVTASGNLTVGDTLYLADQVVHTGDSNTKIRFPTNDVISFHTSGNEAARVDSSGNVGINSTDAQQKLDVLGRIQATATTNQYMQLYPTAGAGYFDVKNPTTYPSIVFRQIGSGGTQSRLTITSAGLIGVNSTSPTYGMHLYGTTSSNNSYYFAEQGSSGASAGFRLKTAGGSHFALYGATSSSALGIYDYNASAERFTIDGSGRVQIGGVTGPNSAKLFVAGTDSTSYVTLRNTSAGDGSGARWNSIRFQGTQSGNEVSDLVQLQANHDGTADDEKGAFQVLVNDGDDGDSLQERFRIDSSGNAAIGGITAAPTSTVYNSGTLHLHQATGGASGGSQLKMTTSQSGSAAGDGAYLAYYGNNMLYIYNKENAGIQFGTNATERLNITSTGDIELHNKTAASTTDPITVDFGGQYTPDASITHQNLKVKLYSNGSSNDAGGLTMGQSGVSYVSSVGAGHLFYTAPSSVDTILERMRIRHDGNIGINTTGVSYSDHIYLAVRGNSTDRGGVVHVGNSDHSVTAQFSVYDSKAWVHTGSSHNLVFGTGGANQHVTLDTSGRMIIGANANFANASIDDLQIGNNSESTQRGITIGSTDECAIAFADAGDARAGSITYNHGTDMMLFKTDGQNTRFDMDNDHATFYPASASTHSFQVRKNGDLDTQDKQCVASFWNSGGTAAGDKRYIAVSSSPDGVYGCHIGSYNDGSNPGWLQAGFYVSTTHNAYLSTSHSMRFKISSAGTFYGSSTTISSISDARLKKNITNYTYDLNKFKQLQPKTFEWINSSEHCDDVRRGFSAQEVESVDNYWILEDTVQSNSKDAELLDADLIVKNSKLGELDAMYVSVINQLISKIETLETKVAALESK